MQIVDLRQIHSRSLEILFQEEARTGGRSCTGTIARRLISSANSSTRARWAVSLALEDGQPAGYGFYVLEDHKGLIGGLFVSSQFAQEPITERLLTEMLCALRATPRLERIEAQLMPFGTELDPAFLSQYFRLHSRQFMLLRSTKQSSRASRSPPGCGSSRGPTAHSNPPRA